jgi:hypothetical protein
MRIQKRQEHKTILQKPLKETGTETLGHDIAETIFNSEPNLTKYLILQL